MKFENLVVSTFILLFISLSNLYSQDKVVNAYRIEEDIELDGYLSETVWHKASPAGGFGEQEPNPGKPARFKTEVRILFNEEYFYVGVMCFDPEPEKIIAREMKWDGYISGDDSFKMLFDTFNDNRTAYWFGTNSLGAQNDALMTGSNYSGFNEDWDGVWEVASQVVDSGWSAEFRFPFSTFKFHDKEEQVWGVNFQRTIKRFSENVIWTSIGKNLGFMKISQAGELRGIENVKRGDPVYLQPYFTAGAQYSGDKETFVHEPGFDLKYGLSEMLTLDVTINTDFAQVESDRAQINLSRFPLFFPEKRDFFLEGAKFLSFDLGGRNNVFYSRRIGINNGEEVPIIGGAKIVGRVKDWAIGFLDMQTAAKGNLNSTNFGTARIKYDVLEQSSVGMIATNKVSKDHYNRTFGADFNFDFNNFLGDKNLNFGMSIAKSEENNAKPNSWAGNFFIDYPNDLISQSLSYRFIQQNFNPEMGFIYRTGIQRGAFDLDITPRIDWGGINKLDFSPLSANITYNANKQLSNALFRVKPVGFRLNEGGRFQINLNREFDFVENTYTIFDTTKIYTDKYWFNYISSYYQSATNRDIYGSVSVGRGEYYGGDRSYLNTNMTFTVNKHLTLTGDYTFNNINLEQSSFYSNETALRVRYDFTTETNTSVFAQWNNELRKINLNYRFNWKPQVGSDVYLVVNQLLSTDGEIKSENFTILAKVVWMFII